MTWEKVEWLKEVRTIWLHYDFLNKQICTNQIMQKFSCQHNEFFIFFSDFFFLLERGRPPKSFANTTPDFGTLDSPPKAKRKSRPPRRHKPDCDPHEEGMDANSDGMMSGVAGIQVFGGTSADSSSLFTFPNINISVSAIRFL